MEAKISIVINQPSPVITVRNREMDMKLSSNMLKLFTQDVRNLFLKVSKSGILLNVFTLVSEFSRGKSLEDLLSPADYDDFRRDVMSKDTFVRQRHMKVSSFEFNYLILVNCDSFSYFIASVEEIKLPTEQLDCIFDAFDIHRPAAIEYEINLLKSELSQTNQAINDF